jgi:hypothetical protein
VLLKKETFCVVEVMCELQVRRADVLEMLECGIEERWERIRTSSQISIQKRRSRKVKQSKEDVEG